jgi:plastocyanin
MRTTKNHQRLTLGVLAAATIIGASACGSTGTGTGPATAAPSAPSSQSAPMDPGMGASAMASSMPSMTGATAGSSIASTDMAPAATIHIKSFAYTGPETVPAGATVTAMNMDTEAHTLTADDGSFDAVVKAGTSVTFTAPAKPGAYAYHCTYHSNMHGTLTVK